MLQTYPLINYNGLEKRKKSAFKMAMSFVKKNMTMEQLQEMEAKKVFQKQLKKIKKAEYIEKNYQDFEFKSYRYKPKYLLNHFTVEKDYDYWKNVYIFNTTDMDKVLTDLDIMDIETHGSTWSSPYDCTGRTFFQPCVFHLLSDRIVVIQTGALDV